MTTEEKKKSIFSDVSVRVSPDEKEYMPLKNGDGWLVGVGRPRAAEVSKTTRLFIAAALKRGCALFATNGGIRIMSNANGDHGVCFIEHNQMTKGEEVFLFTGDKKEIESLGMKVTREQKSFYVSMKTAAGESSFNTIYDNFLNNRTPRGWVVHPWPNMKISAVEKINVVKKKTEKKNIVKKKIDNKASKKEGVLFSNNKIVKMPIKKDDKVALPEKKKRPKETIVASSA